MGSETDMLPYVTLCLVLITPWFFHPDSVIRYHGKFAVYYVLTSAWALVLWPVFLLRPRHFDNARISTYFTKHVAKLIGIEFQLENGEILAEDNGAIVVSNHQSTLDILGLFNIWTVPYKVAAIAKKEILYVFPFGPVAWLGGVVFIDRSSTERAYKTLTETAKLVGDNKVKMWLYPEGTRNRSINLTKKLLPFKRGAFKMAIHCQAPIIPIVYSPYYFMDQQKNYFGSGKIIIKTLPPIPTTGLTEEDITRLMDQTWNVMQEALDELCARTEASLPPSHPFRTKAQS